MKKWIIFVFVVILCTGTNALSLAGQVAVSFLSPDDPSSIVVKGILPGAAEERSEEDAKEAGDEDDTNKIVEQLTRHGSMYLIDQPNGRYFVASIEHYGEKPILPPRR